MTSGMLPALIVLGLFAVLGALIPTRRRRSGRWNLAKPTRNRGTPFLDLSDHGDQLKAVEAAILKPKKPVNSEASRVLIQLEHITRQRPARRYRIFAEMSLGAFVATEGPRDRKEIGHLAWRAISAKRLDFLIIDGRGYPAVAIEYHGTGHHQEGGQAAARDAVKRRALEKAGIELVEIQANYDTHQSQLMVEHALDRYEGRADNTSALCAAP
jgi:hypothetical protein